jgi:hypothetical protein
MSFMLAIRPRPAYRPKSGLRRCGTALLAALFAVTFSPTVAVGCADDARRKP